MEKNLIRLVIHYNAYSTHFGSQQLTGQSTLKGNLDQINPYYKIQI